MGFPYKRTAPRLSTWSNQKRWLALAIVMVSVNPRVFAAEPPADDFDARARAVVAKMTLDEKIGQMHGTSDNKTVHRIVIGLPRLGIPDLLITNGPAGVGPAGPGHGGKATALPAPIALAATWDIAASKEYGVIAASEAAGYGNTLLESPDINIARVPQNGRTFEAFGEDPYLVGQLSVAHILGIQSQGIIANVKHFAANNQEQFRHSVNAIVDERTLREIYYPAFEASVKQGHVASVMAAYNRLNGAFCCENGPLLVDALVKDWGFDGFVMSDFTAVDSTVPTVMNGLDLEMPSGKFLGDKLKAAVDAKQVPVSVIDEHLVRRFRAMMKLGVWDHMPARKPVPAKENGAIARHMAEQAMVLLRNQGDLLPLKSEAIQSIALIGPSAATAMTGGGGSSKVQPIYQVSPLEGLQKRLGPGVKIALVPGMDLAAATAAAKAADVAIVMVGDHQEEGIDHAISLDRAVLNRKIKLDKQDELVEAVAAANPRTVVVVKSGGPVLMPWADKAPAILEAWYPGEEDGAAVAAVLFGDVNPSGKLPMTFPKSIDDVPAYKPEQYPGVANSKGKTTEEYSEKLLVGYRWYDAANIAPLYPFGFGLSYTTFAYKNLALSTAELSAGGKETVTFDLENTGARDGAEVAQVYAEFPPAAGEPPRQLKGFVKLHIAAKASTRVLVELDDRAFEIWDTASHAWKTVPGDYFIHVGGSSRDLRLSGRVQVR